MPKTPIRLIFPLSLPFLIIISVIVGCMIVVSGNTEDCITPSCMVIFVGEMSIAGKRSREQVEHAYKTTVN